MRQNYFWVRHLEVTASSTALIWCKNFQQMWPWLRTPPVGVFWAEGEITSFQYLISSISNRDCESSRTSLLDFSKWLGTSDSCFLLDSATFPVFDFVNLESRLWHVSQVELFCFETLLYFWFLNFTWLSHTSAAGDCAAHTVEAWALAVASTHHHPDASDLYACL